MTVSRAPSSSPSSELLKCGTLEILELNIPVFCAADGANGSALAAEALLRLVVSGLWPNNLAIGTSAQRHPVAGSATAIPAFTWIRYQSLAARTSSEETLPLA